MTAALRASVGTSPATVVLSAVLLIGCAVLALGLATIAGDRARGFTWNGVAQGIASQLPRTLPAAYLVAFATAANVLAGAIVLRLLARRPFATLADLALGGLAGAVLIDVVLLFSLGSVGLFGMAELALVHAAIFVAAWRGAARPLLAAPWRLRSSVPATWWILVVAIWVGPLILQLASPVVPFMDVLPNHVAPVQHVRSFGDFATLNTSPSPIYGPSRLLLGYVALLGTVTTLTGLGAAIAVAAFALPLTILCGVAVWRLAAALFGPIAGYFALLAFPLTFTFVRLGDSRGTVLVFPVAAWALATLAARAWAAKSPVDAGSGRRRRLPEVDLPLAIALGAALLVHPLVGALAYGTAAGAVLFDPSRLARRVIPALAGAGALALPQLATMLSLALPSWVGLLALPLGLALALALAAVLDHFAIDWRSIVLALVVTALIALIVFARLLLPTVIPAVAQIAEDFPLLGLLSAAAVFLTAPWRGGRSLRAWAVLAPSMALVTAADGLVSILPNKTLFEQALHYEVPKALEYWLPAILAVAASGGLAAIWQRRRLGFVRHVALAAFLLVAVYPLSGPIVAPIDITEHRAAESLAADLRTAERGYWFGYPDVRLVIDADEREVLDFLRSQETAGRLGPATRVLHVAKSFQQWDSIPIGVFDGALETSISLKPEVSIHTDGGRLLGLDRLDAELAAGYGYVVLEPSKELPADLDGRILAAGYQPIFKNDRAIVYGRA